MVDYDLFRDVIYPATGRNIDSNENQKSIISSSLTRSIKVVAGPGSGKTTVIVLRLMKLVFVDGIEPQNIIATTFTVKAAEELKSRVLSWGISIKKKLIPLLSDDAKERDRLHRLNFDQIKIGTLDAIAQETLIDECRADQDPPIVIQEFIAKHFMVSEWFNHHDIQKGIVEELKEMGFDSYKIGSPLKPRVSGVVENLLDFHNRMMENGIDPKRMKKDYPNLSTILVDYNNKLLDKKILDFASLESRFQTFVSTSESDRFFENLKIVMVDEYQDTNLLQESIYKEFAKRAVSNGGSFIAVGDDDQSIYRFRGSRVHLFADIENRFKSCGVMMETEHLSVNYRSSKEIVDFCNEYVNIDHAYQDVRAKDKPSMSVARTDGDNFPVFGIFRDSLEELARDVASLIYQFSYNGSYRFVDTGGYEYLFEKSSDGGVGDVVLLMSSTANRSPSGKQRLPELLADELLSKSPPIIPFNPRGIRLCDDPNIATLVGTLIWCIDPGYKLLSKMKLDGRGSTTRDMWKEKSSKYIECAPNFEGISLKDIVHAWSTGTPYPKSNKWTKNKVTVLDILYNLLPWFSEHRNNAEAMVSIQAFFNAISSAAIIKGDELTIKFNKGTNLPMKKSVEEFYKYIIRPLLEDSLDVDESLFFSIPSDNRFNIMTIHQSKGLEYPITIVDVCSEFEINNPKQALKRFPRTLDGTSIVEDVLSKYCPDIKTKRNGIDMQFDDLIRKYYVAFSRAQDVLILVGLRKSIVGKNLENMAMGWTRDKRWVWERMNNLRKLRSSNDN